MRRTPHDPMARRLRALGFTESAAVRLARAGTPIDLDAGVPLTVEGERGAEAFLILDGEAVVELADGPGVGGPGARRNATVRTTERSLVLVYDVATFRGLAATDLRPLLVPERTPAAA
jgi:porphobilinogen deaminase